MAQMYITCVILMILDVITGIINAAKDGKIESTVMRKGLYNKFCEMATLAATHVIQYATANIDIGVDLHLFNIVAIYIIVMEIVSILENICLMNEGIGKIFAPILNQLKHYLTKESEEEN